MAPEPKLLPLITRILARQGTDPELLEPMAALLADQLGPATLDVIAWTVRRLLNDHPEYLAPPPQVATGPAPPTLEDIQPGMPAQTRRDLAFAAAAALRDLGHLPPPPDLTGPPVDLESIHKDMTAEQQAAARLAIARALTYQEE
jgi:hypothetical protein